MTVKVSPKYQVVIPLPVRKALGLTAGAKIEVLAKGDVAYLVPVKSLKDLQRSLAGKLSAEGAPPLRDKKDRL